MHASIPWIHQHQWLAQFKAALICSTVVLMRLLTVATDSAFSFDDGRLLTRIWNATVTSDPAGGDTPSGPAALDDDGDAPARPSGRMVKPDGSSGIADGSSPLITTLAAGMSIGAYTTSDPDASVQLSCRISMLFWLAFRPYKKHTSRITFFFWFHRDINTCTPFPNSNSRRDRRLLPYS